MKSLKKQRRIQIIALTAIALVLSTALIGYAMRDGINFFRTPTEVTAAPPPDTETFRLGGMVETGSVERGQGEVVRFVVTDCAAAIPVAFAGILPDLFAEGQATVVTGRLVGGTFEATEVLAKHDESYVPAEMTDSMKDRGGCAAPDAAADAAPTTN